MSPENDASPLALQEGRQKEAIAVVVIRLALIPSVWAAGLPRSKACDMRGEVSRNFRGRLVEGNAAL